MAGGSAIIGFTPWLQTASGQYLLEWEQHHADQVVVDLFGFHALQLGLPELDALRANRMRHRWVATERAPAFAPDAADTMHRVDLHCNFDALPFDSSSLDLVVLPHALELARDPHLALREVERVLVPEGRVVIIGFNPASLWGVRQGLGRWRRRMGWGLQRELFLPSAGEPIAYRRLRDWLRLLSFEVEAGRFGCFLPPLASSRWLARLGWMDAVGERWWPVFGAVYYLVAVKRVRGMRLVGLLRNQRMLPASNAATAVHHNRRCERNLE